METPMPHTDQAAWRFHPYEIALVGYQNSGKTTLATKLVARLGLSLAYIKQDAHHFDLDKPGKDTHTLSQAGAHSVFISDGHHRAHLSQEPLHSILSRTDFLEEDAALVEGHKSSPVPIIVLLDHELAILADANMEASSVLAYAGPWATAPEGLALPYFCRDDDSGLAAFVRGFWDAKTARRPLLGLVLTGGRSTRMGSDKAALSYHGLPEATRMFHLLKEFCPEVYVSCQADQADDPGRQGLAQIHDTHLGLGPLSGLLSAFQARPEASWLVVACDLPGVAHATLAHLLEGRNPFRFATAFRGYQELPEPLCAIYEPKARSRLYQFLAAGYDCPRKMLIHSPIALLDPPHRDQLSNLNTPEDAHAFHR